MTFIDPDGATGGNIWGDPDAAIARVNAQIAEAAERAERAEDVRRDVDALRARASSPGGEVTVEVDATGRLTNIEFESAARTLRSDALSQAVLKAAASAQRQAGDRAVAIAADAFGEESEVTAHLRAEVEERMPPATDDTTLGYR
ncbi:YbaB/EbfC family nucleoid-associated protein [Leifsonia flava]|uniref:YbaB/EbfC family DNA-binding protein n=1 Tax=Orlajensenia leifsoniae TaxID=2561933 RepID=A0A4Y9QYB0_9MICO|nr:YbaB/EbfC family nucleoid-associated protein [Leifsonia flava]TFV96642.1 YbaB/EbfC family DNA-binding protein [Leifsonia flava]